jgi:hypothetical protein
MRIKLAVAAAAAAALTAGTGAAAYAVVGHSTVSPTVAGNDQPIDDNHSPVPSSRPLEPGDDRGEATTTAPPEDRGHGGDRGGGRGGADDGPGHR